MPWGSRGGEFSLHTSFVVCEWACPSCPPQPEGDPIPEETHAGNPLKTSSSIIIKREKKEFLADVQEKGSQSLQNKDDY